MQRMRIIASINDEFPFFGILGNYGSCNKLKLINFYDDENESATNVDNVYGQNVIKLYDATSTIPYAGRRNRNG